MSLNPTFAGTRTDETILLYPDGLGFGEGRISVRARLQDLPERALLTPEIMQMASDIIQSDWRAFHQVDAGATDDGCGDGRPTGEIYMVASTGQKNVLNRSLLRAKVFGGGLIVASSMFRTSVFGQITADDNVLNDRKRVAQYLNQMGIKFGGHTDDHAIGDDCGCGAIDKYELITNNAIKYHARILTVLQAVFAQDYGVFEPAINEVFKSYEDQYTNTRTYFFKNDAGRLTQKLLEENGAVIKELGGEHQEVFVVLNEIENESFDQPTFRNIIQQRLTERGTPGEVQVFAVDIWRGRMYANTVADIAAAEFGAERNEVYKRALVDFFVRTLATSATLTAGDQPVYLRRPAVATV